MILGLLLACAVSVAVLSTAAETAVNRAYDYVEAPPSAVDMVMRSRETAPAEPRSTPWALVGLLAVGALVAGGFILGLRNGGEFLRQGRLTLRAWQRPATSPAPRLEQVASAPWEDAPAARRPAALPYHDDFYQD